MTINVVEEFFALEPSERVQKRGLGNGLYGIVLKKPKNKKYTSKLEGKYWYWKNAKFQPKRLGVCNKVSEKEARKKVAAIKDWVRQGRNPKFFGRPSDSDTKTFKNAADSWYNSEDVQRFISPITRQNYKNQLYNQALPFIGKDTLLKELQWRDETNGRQIILDMVATLKKGRKGEQARKVLGVCRQVFNHAIDQNWMSKNSNPAMLPHKWKQIKDHNPTISWDEVPQLLQDINRNEANGTYEVQMVVKMLLMTSLRASALVQLRWSWIKEVDGIKCFEIPAGTIGCKHGFYKVLQGNGTPHYVPITDGIQELLDDIRPKTGHSDYVFYSPRGKKFEHVCPDAPNKHLRKLGWGGKLTAHGWRSVFLTVGQDSLSTDHEILQRQMGHAIGDHVRQAYDRSKQLVARAKFLQQWCQRLVESGLVIREENY